MDMFCAQTCEPYRINALNNPVLPLLFSGPCVQAMGAPGGMEHPGILHLYCHLMELSDDPTAAMPAADALRTLYPSAGHLTHMASHIDIWAGQYKVRMPAQYLRWCNSDRFPSLYL